MKKLIGLLCILFLLAGCKAEPQVEVIPNYDKVYLTPDNVDTHPQITESDEEKLIARINEEINKTNLEKEQVKLDYKLMIDEQGALKKLEIVESPGKQFDDIVLQVASTWKFDPAKVDGKKVKSQLRWKFSNQNNFAAAQINKEDYQTQFDETPFPVGGMGELSKKIVYPEKAKQEGFEGKVILQVFIDETGTVVKSEVLKGAGNGLDEAAIKAVELTKFTPAKVKGKIVKAKVVLPIVFKLS
ncbi:MAG: TonB family protein [Ignavibacteriales bacterium]|nr:MAG: TonB family protein [Ignavibacteriales bacterium]